MFAFGRTWDNLARGLGLPLVDALGAGGRPNGSTVDSRAVRVYHLHDGQRLIVEWHSGSVGPPRESEVAVLKQALN